MQDAEVQEWITAATGRTVRSVERVGYGASRATYIAELDDGDLVARVDNGDGPMARTELSLAREAQVYRALAGTGVRIPRLHAVAADGMAILADRAPGTHTFEGLSDEQRHAIYDDYIDALADLHNVAIDDLDLPSYRRPRDPASHATLELDLWQGILHDRTIRSWPLARFALSALRQAAPTSVARTVLCHGDVGPGNFMHDGRRVTALLDWEFSHLGDPMDDLAWWVFRGHDMAGGCGDLAAQLARWSARTGLPVDTRSIEYYRAFVMLRWLISVAAALDTGGAGMDRSVYFGLVPLLAVRLPQALGPLLGVTLPPAMAAPTGEPGPAAEVLDVLGSDLRQVIAPAVREPEAARRAMAAELYLSHLAMVDRIGVELRAAELEDLRSVLGRDVSVDDGQRAILELADQPDRTTDLLGYFWRSGQRQVALWPLVAPRAMAAPTPIAFAGAT